MNDNKLIRITSVDNPYDPFTQFEEWYLFDINAGYNTCARLDRVTYTSDALSDDELFDAIERGVDQLIKTGCLTKKGTLVEYKKVIKDS